MKKIRCYIVDDEDLARYTLKKKLMQFPDIEIAGEADGIRDAKKEISELDPDLLFLDIQLSEGTGFDLLKQIRFNGKIIFVTAYDEYAIRAFEVNAVDYLLKPISNRRLNNAIARVKEGIQADSGQEITPFKYDDRVLVSIGNSMYFLKLSSVVTLSAAKNYTIIKDRDGNDYIISKTMAEWEQRLPEENFCRISRTMIVNFDYIDKSEKWTNNTALIYIKGYDEAFKLSKFYFKKVKNRYK
ncbi:LytR/AlgR family response regulator transcription factor [Bacteroidota bacterium]